MLKRTMKQISVIAAVMLLALLVGMPASAQSQPIQADTVSAAEQADYQILTGKIGPYEVKMHLRISGAQDDDEVGYYYYTAHPDNRFKLKMISMVAVNAKGTMELVLHEYTAQGKNTGTFDGNYECRGDHYAGTFTNSKGEKFKFVLE